MNIFRPQKKPSPIPQTTPMQKQRQKQVASLRTHFPHMIEVVKDSKYQLKFGSVGTEHTLYIRLPYHFPNERPVIVVYPPLEHPWFNDSNTIVGFKQLNEFTMHQDIGRVVDTLVKELSLYHNSSQPREVKPQFYTPPNSFASPPIELPPISATPPMVPVITQDTTGGEEHNRWIQYEAIDNLELEKLKELSVASDDGQLLAYMDFEGFQAEGEKGRVRLLQENLELAQENIQYEPFLAQERESLIEKQRKVQELLAEFRQREKQQERLMDFSEFRVMQSLELLVNEDNARADKMSDEFLEGKVGLQTFLHDYTETKESSFLRSAKHYKLQQILSDTRHIPGPN